MEPKNKNFNISRIILTPKTNDIYFPFHKFMKHKKDSQKKFQTLNIIKNKHRNKFRQSKHNITSYNKSYSFFPKLSKNNNSPDNIPLKTSINNNKKKKNYESQKTINVDLLTFDPSLKILTEKLDSNPYNKKFIEERLKKKEELYFDYDKKNAYIVHNSFSGNNPSLLKSKVLFVKGVYDYIYPRIVIKKMKLLEIQKENEIKEKVGELNEEFNKHKIFIKRHRTPEEKIKMSKYELNGAVSNESIKIKGNLIKLRKILINSHLVTKLTNLYDYK